MRKRRGGVRLVDTLRWPRSRDSSSSTGSASGRVAAWLAHTTQKS